MFCCEVMLKIPHIPSHLSPAPFQYEGENKKQQKKFIWMVINIRFVVTVFKKCL